MRILTDLNNLPTFKNAVVTTGSFDGLHRGHQKILRRLNEIAKQKNGESVIITFHPHPRKALQQWIPKGTTTRPPIELITTRNEKIALFEKYGVDNLVIASFSQEFANLTAQEYIESFLVDNFHPASIIIGYDHRFGQGRKGDVNLMHQYAPKHNYEIVEIKKQMVNEISISSTKIRNALKSGQVALAHQMLGHPYTITGEIVRGKQIGQKIGFPTANISIPPECDKLLPAAGVYAVQATLDGLTYGGMLYIGKHPMQETDKDLSIEVNLFNFDKDIYGQELQISLFKKIRDNQKFPSIDILKQQLQQDKASVLKILATL